MNTVRYGIIGLGKQGSHYALSLTKMKFLHRGGRLAAVCDISAERREWAESKLPDSVAVFDDYNEMFTSGLIDAVVIVSAHYEHPTIAAAGFDAGLHVLCDKPAGVYTKQVREMNEAAAAHPELTFGLMLNQRTDPVYRRAKEMIDNGELGAMKRILWIVTDWYRPQSYYDQGGWRGTWDGEGGGVLINQCPHQLDLFTWLAGLPVSVRAVAKTVGRNIKVENDVMATCTFESGAEGAFIASTHDHPGTNRLEISGDNGKIVIENGVLTFTRNSVPEPEFSSGNAAFMGRMKTRKRRYRGIGAYLNYLRKPLFHEGIFRDFTDKVLGRTDHLLAPGEEGLTGLSFSNAIHLSSWTGSVVTLPLDEEQYLAELNKRRAAERDARENN